MIPGRLHTIRIKWTYPIPLNRKDNSAHIFDECGLYYITRRYLRCSIGERNLYVGETKRSFYDRLREHVNINKPSRWTFGYGEKFIRFGLIQNLPKFEEDSELKKFLRTIETMIIWQIDPEENDLTNVSQMKSADLAYRLRIINEGFRGNIPKVISPIS